MQKRIDSTLALTAHPKSEPEIQSDSKHISFYFQQQLSLHYSYWKKKMAMEE